MCCSHETFSTIERKTALEVRVAKDIFVHVLAHARWVPHSHGHAEPLLHGISSQRIALAYGLEYMLTSGTTVEH